MTANPSNGKHFKDLHLPTLRVGLRAKVFLWGLLALLFVLPLLCSILWFTVNLYLFRNAEYQTDQALDSFESLLQLDNSNLQATGRWLAGQADFITLVRERKAKELTQTLQSLLQTNTVDFILVTDPQDAVMAQVPEIRSMEEKDKVPNLDDLSGNSPDREWCGALEGFDDDWYELCKVPVFDGRQVAPIGALILGYRLDGSYLKRIANRGPVQYALIADEHFAVTTLTDKNGNPWSGRFAPTTWTDLFAQLQAIQMPLVQTDQLSYLFKFRPLRLPGHAKLEFVGAGISTQLLDQQRTFLTGSAWLIGLSSLIALGIVGYVFGRTLTGPLDKLKNFVQGMTAGDLKTPIALPRSDEFGDLANELEHLRTSFQDKFQKLDFDSEWNASVIHAMSEPLVITNNALEIASANPAAEQMLRQNGHSLIGRSWDGLFVIGDKKDREAMPFWQPRAAAADGKQELVVRGRFPLRSHPDVVLDITSAQVHVNGQTQGYVHILHDASEVEHFSRVKDEYLLNVAHELQSPLASIHSSVDILLDDYPNLNKRELGVMLKNLERSVIRFESLVGVLIDIGKLEAGRFRIRATPTLINKLVQDGIAQIEPLLGVKGQTLQVKLDCPPATAVMADRPRIIQVIVNFLRNAHKYGPEDQPIEVSTYVQGGFVFVEVTDHGAGISPEEQLHLFERFYRGKRAEEEGAGIGIGLALSRGIIKAHNGNIGLRSEVGKGASFWFSLAEVTEPVTEN